MRKPIDRGRKSGFHIQPGLLLIDARSVQRNQLLAEEMKVLCTDGCVPESSLNVMSLNVNGMFAEKLESESGLKKCIERYDCAFVSETQTNKFSNIDIYKVM